MLIYHTHCYECFNDGRDYKSSVKQCELINPPKVSDPVSRKRVKCMKNRNLSCKNKKFLEGLGLKVKQGTGNC